VIFIVIFVVSFGYSVYTWFTSTTESSIFNLLLSIDFLSIDGVPHWPITGLAIPWAWVVVFAVVLTFGAFHVCLVFFYFLPPFFVLLHHLIVVLALCTLIVFGLYGIGRLILFWFGFSFDLPGPISLLFSLFIYLLRLFFSWSPVTVSVSYRSSSSFGPAIALLLGISSLIVGVWFFLTHCLPVHWQRTVFLIRESIKLVLKNARLLLFAIFQSVTLPVFAIVYLPVAENLYESHFLLSTSVLFSFIWFFITFHCYFSEAVGASVASDIFLRDSRSSVSTFSKSCRYFLGDAAYLSSIPLIVYLVLFVLYSLNADWIPESVQEPSPSLEQHSLNADRIPELVQALLPLIGLLFQWLYGTWSSNALLRTAIFGSPAIEFSRLPHADSVCGWPLLPRLWTLLGCWMMTSTVFGLIALLCGLILNEKCLFWLNDLFVGWAIGIAWLSVSITFGNIICSVAHALQICYVKSPVRMYHQHKNVFQRLERWEDGDRLEDIWPFLGKLRRSLKRWFRSVKDSFYGTWRRLLRK
jgi:hypothetical protein